jgi:hypothetical protein
MNKIEIIKDAAEKAMTAESERTKNLIARTEKFIAGIVIVTGFQLLDLPTLLASSSPFVKVSCYLALAALSISLLPGFYSLQLKGYASHPRGDKLWESLKAENISDDAADQAIIQLLLKTREQNAKLNDAKVNSLFWCGWLFVVGFLLVVGSQLLYAIINSQ